MLTNLGTDIHLASDMAQYDAYCKRILANKEILSRILGRVVKEFQGMEFDEIAACIEDDLQISTVPVDPGMTNQKRVTGIQTEDKIPLEGVIYYDIRFTAKVPQNDGRIKLIINIEAQKKYHPGYDIVTRGIFYNSRQISAQLGTEFNIPDYQELKKVYSIWVCFSAPRKEANAISEYSITKRDIIPGIADNPESYDKFSVIVIALNSRVTSGDELVRMLNTLFGQQTISEKKTSLKSFGINTDNLGKEMEYMCNLSGLVLETGQKQGLKKGKKEGKRQGREQTLTRLSILSKKLQELGKVDDLIKATTDSVYLEELYKKYGI